MDSAFALPTGLESVNMADIALKIVFLTVPGIALAKGLERFRTPGRMAGDGRGDRIKASLNRLGGKFASFVSILALLAAGLGLVPLVEAIYRLVSRTGKAAPALIGAAVLTLLLVKGFVMSRDLMDGKVDRPWLWLTPVPLLAVLIWVAPVVFNQITDQAGQSIQLILKKYTIGVPDRGRHGQADDSPKDKQHTQHGGTHADH